MRLPRCADPEDIPIVRTPIAEQLDIEFPIFAFSHCRDVIAAVSRAGGFGVLGALAFTPEELEIELNWIDEHVDGKPYGVDIVMPMKYMGKGGGDEADFSNLDAMIPQSHRDFVEQLLERHHVPELPAALALGAQGVWTGSQWLTVAEANTSPVIMERLLAATSRDTVRSRAYTGKPARQLRSAWTEAFDDPEGPGTLPMPLQGILHQEAARRFMRVNNKELTGFPVGQIVGRLNDVRPTKDVIFDMVEEWIATTERLNTLLG